MQTAQLLIPFSDIDSSNHDQIGKEGKKIGELTQAGFPLPTGFFVTQAAYFNFLKSHKIDHHIKQLLTTVRFDYPETIFQISNNIRKLFFDAQLPEDLIKKLTESYERIGSPRVTITGQSHTTDFPHHSHQLANDMEELLLKIKNAWADHFTANILASRNEKNIDHIETGTSLIVQEIIDPEKEGIVITIDPVTHDKNKLFIAHHASHGNETYVLSKKNLTILERTLRPRKIGDDMLSLDDLLDIGQLAKDLEQILYFPQQIHWAFIGEQIYVLKAIPYTDLPKPAPEKVKKHALARGHSLTHTIGTGSIRVIKEKRDFLSLTPHDIVVTHAITPSDLKQLKHIRGIISETGEKHSEVSAYLKRHGIPTLYDVKYATRALKNGQVITIHGGKGEIYAG